MDADPRLVDDVIEPDFDDAFAVDAATVEAFQRDGHACVRGLASPAEVADAFCDSRLGTAYDGTYGMLTSGGLRSIVDRTTPVVED